MQLHVLHVLQKFEDKIFEMREKFSKIRAHEIFRLLLLFIIYLLLGRRRLPMRPRGDQHPKEITHTKFTINKFSQTISN